MHELKFVVTCSQGDGEVVREFSDMEEALSFCEDEERGMRFDGPGSVRMDVVTIVRYYSSSWTRERG